VQALHEALDDVAAVEHGSEIVERRDGMRGTPVVLPGRVTRRLATSLSLLVSPEAYPNASDWRCAVARDLRCLVGADAALVAVEGSGSAAFHAIDLDASIVRAYEDHFASVDSGIARQRSLAIDVWCRRCLWNGADLHRSEYYQDFARPNRLLDAFGISVLTGSTRVRISLLCSRVSSARRSTSARLRMLELLLPAFRTGVALSLTTHDRATRDPMTNIIDCIDHPLALCDDTGRELHHNGALDRAAAVLGGEQLVSTIGQVTRAVAMARRTTPNGGIVSVNVATPDSEWRVRGSTLPWVSDRRSPILVSLARNEVTSAASAESLRARYGLTAREAQVTELLRRRRSNTEIARTLGISAHTARHHTESILLKLHLQSRNQVEERLARDDAPASPTR
jgi:DNA-binding CsgD family transcriptional regulator